MPNLNDPDERNPFVYFFVRAAFTIIVQTRLIRLTVRGVENVPETGAAILMSNHQSNLDPFLIGWTFQRPISIPGKVELFKVPVLGSFLRMVGGYPVDRDIADSASLRRSIRMLQLNRLVVLFPEGTRTRDGRVGPFAPTLTKVAARHRTPIIPVAMAGMNRLLPPNTRLPRFGTRVAIIFGSPLHLSSGEGPRPSEAEIQNQTEEIRERVIALQTEAEALLSAH